MLRQKIVVAVHNRHLPQLRGHCLLWPLLLGGVLLVSVPMHAQPADPSTDPKPDPRPASLSAAAQETFAKLQKAKVTARFTNIRLGEILKEFAAQVDMQTDGPVMWTYGPNFPYAQKITFECRDVTLATALDELFKKNGQLGYIVISKPGDRRDGWILLTTTGERGYERGREPPPALTAAEEADAADKLMLAKKLIASGKNDSAKVVLGFILKRYPGAKVAAEAKQLLEKLESPAP
ncbi:MAG: hypothetical protein RMJ56_09995 [Gemmataceae bacterium]|nr:hypothetical protein [Gemmata sp.]MDW8197921.1 hypothetical protein [Gemmataceae bacterium]